MSDFDKALFGAWVQAIGTALSAIGSTPSFKLNETTQTSLSLIGNVMQGTGNALIADSEEEISLGKIGNQIQAIGNSTEVIGIFTENEKVETNLYIKGDLLQALGSAISLPDLFYSEKKSIYTLLDIYANILQAIGNTLQALSEKIRDEEKGQLINSIGSWIQAIGALLQALIQGKSDGNTSYSL